MARRIPAGSKIFVQAHYWKAKGTVEKDRSMIGLVFAKSPPEKQVLTQLLINNYFLIPPGAARHRVNACWTTDKDIQIISFMPHMHWRGVSMRVEAFYPDGKSEVLLNVPNYRFAWQTVYYLEKPKDIPKGTKLSVEAIFDNSANNRYNPDPAQAVRAGEPTYDEMMASFIDYTVADQGLRGDRVKANK
jgi:Copper type II ascorbate-dependent monooxygenase, C-terminal domain